MRAQPSLFEARQTATPEFSLLLASIGRVEEARHFLRCLRAQRVATGVQLVVVDQSPDSVLAPLAAEATDDGIDVAYLPTPGERGLSRARNRAIPLARGRIVGFPDDDCWYSTTTLEVVARHFRHTDSSGIVGDIVTERPGGTCRPPPGPERPSAPVSFRHFRSNSPTLFLRREALHEVGGFDERIGAGSVGDVLAGEESDLVLRCVIAGLDIVHDPNLVVFHPDEVTLSKAFSYGRADAIVWGRYRRQVGVPILAYKLTGKIVRPLRHLPLGPKRALITLAESIGYGYGTLCMVLRRRERARERPRV